MAAKVALAALVGLGLLIVGMAAAHVVLAESTASATVNTAVAAECRGVSADCEGAARRGHVAWNAASWLVGLGLVVAVGRRGARLGAD